MMRRPSNLLLAAVFFVLAAVLLVLIATHKTKVTVSPQIIEQDDTVSNYISEIEKQNAIERDQKEQEEKLATLAKAKKDSVECQFWVQQKQNKSKLANIDEKITQFCELNAEQSVSANSARSTQTL